MHEGGCGAGVHGVVAWVVGFMQVGVCCYDYSWMTIV